jgi:predicted RNA-binding Zn ribbon-like protein
VLGSRCKCGAVRVRRRADPEPRQEEAQKSSDGELATDGQRGRHDVTYISCYSSYRLTRCSVTCPGIYIWLQYSCMEPLFLGGHPALDFINTTFCPEGERVEVIGNGAAFVDWLIRAGLLTEIAAARLKRRLGVQGLDGAASEARALREWASRWISRWSRDPDGDYGVELRRLNGLLHHARYHRELVSEGDHWRLRECSNTDSGEDLLAVIATQVALLVTNEAPTLVKACAGVGCTLWFLDGTKGHRRAYCSASGCGNRAKVAAFRARQKVT